jgi:hypothetical protein
MKYCITALSLLIKRIKDSLFILILLGAITSCKKDQNSSSTPTIPIVQPPVDVGKVTVTTGIPIVSNNKTIAFSGDVSITAPATVTTKYLVITWFNDTLHVAESETVFNLTYTKTNCIPGTKYTVKAAATGSTGTVYGSEGFGTTTGFHIGQTFNGFKVWDVWSNNDSAQLIGNLLADKYAWGCQGVDVPGTSSDYGTGMANSLKIKVICPASAANLCLTDTALGSGSYLGSEGEWVKLFQNMVKANINTNGAVWCSTQENFFYGRMVKSTGVYINAKMVNTSTVFLGPSVYAFKKVGR